MNLYAYVGNDPVNATDPTGRQTCCTTEQVRSPKAIGNIREAPAAQESFVKVAEGIAVSSVVIAVTGPPSLAISGAASASATTAAGAFVKGRAADVVTGAVAGGVGAAIEGGDPSLGAAAGAAGGWIGNNASTTAGSFTSKAVSAVIGYVVGAVVGGASNAIVQAVDVDQPISDQMDASESERAEQSQNCSNGDC